MTDPMASADACSADFSCSRCDLLVGLPGLHVMAVQEVTGKRGTFLRVQVDIARAGRGLPDLWRCDA